MVADLENYQQRWLHASDEPVPYVGFTRSGKAEGTGMLVSALVTDYYELCMMQGNFATGHNPDVVFDMFYRNNPSTEERRLHRTERFGRQAGGFTFIRRTSVPEVWGRLPNHSSLISPTAITVICTPFPRLGGLFPGEPLVRVHTSLIEAQLIEGILLNTLNFQTLIATKAARMTEASGRGTIMEFGLRRAQGEDGALSASRAAFIGGCKVTSNVLAGKHDIPVAGLWPHWIMISK
jgi:nicotinate phosphoribosyltransferase